MKKRATARLLEAIGEVHEGGAPMSPEIASKVIQLFQRLGPPPQADHNLTAQEVRLLTLLGDGQSYRAAAALLDISINTVRNHIRSIYDKLHVHSKSAAVSQALKRRIIT